MKKKLRAANLKQNLLVLVKKKSVFDKILNSSLLPVTFCGKAPSQMFDRVLRWFILDVWQGFEYASAIYTTISIKRLPIRGIGFFCL